VDPKFRANRHQLEADRSGVAVVLKPISSRFWVLDTMSSAA